MARYIRTAEVEAEQLNRAQTIIGVQAEEGDWLVTEDDGNRYVVTSDDFDEEYEAVEDLEEEEDEEEEIQESDEERYVRHKRNFKISSIVTLSVLFIFALIYNQNYYKLYRSVKMNEKNHQWLDGEWEWSWKKDAKELYKQQHEDYLAGWATHDYVGCVKSAHRTYYIAEAYYEQGWKLMWDSITGEGKSLTKDGSRSVRFKDINITDETKAIEALKCFEKAKSYADDGMGINQETKELTEEFNTKSEILYGKCKRIVYGLKTSLGLKESWSDL